MEKEIKFKFRAWNGEGSVMVYDILPLPSGNVADVIDNEEVINAWQGDKPVAVMQFTGLKDKTGKEIYEGDIIKTNFKIYDNNPIPRLQQEYDEIGEVVFRSSAWRIADDKHGKYNTWCSDNEVIGNIYQNPELLGS